MRTLFMAMMVACLAAEEAPKPFQPEASVVLIRGIQDGAIRQGSGVVVSPGVVATNAHVVSGCTTVVILKGKDAWIAKDFCVEQERDLCLMNVPDLKLAPAQAASPQEMVPGQEVQSIGYPAGIMQTRKGRLSATWAYRGSNLLQSDAPIAPGSSGGGLFTEDGKLLGITTFVYGGQGKLNFSIPIDWIGRLQDGGILSARLVCPGIARENITTEFFEHITEDPANWTSWEALAETWVREAPEDPKAWYAQGLALDLRLRQATQLEDSNQILKRMEETLSAYQHAIQLGPRLSKAWNNLGVILDTLNRFEEAQKAFRRATELKPRDPLLWVNLGVSLSNGRQYREAAEAFRTGLSLEPDNATAWSRLAYAEGALKEWPEAARDYRIALRLNPFRVSWWSEYYQACRHIQDLAGARQALDRLTDLDPALATSLAAASSPPPKKATRKRR
jgi:cytochrome c-type biogenesis protein CcmH/NrfG